MIVKFGGVPSHVEDRGLRLRVAVQQIYMSMWKSASEESRDRGLGLGSGVSGLNPKPLGFLTTPKP